MSDQQIAKDPVKALAERYPLCVLETLLRDRTTGKNIVWAGNEYEPLGDGYGPDDEITVDKVTGRQGGVVMPRIAKEAERRSRRTKARAEVFTPSWLCNRMSNDIDEAWFGRRDVFNVETVNPDGTHAWAATTEPVAFPKAKGHGWQCYVKSRRLEITCGEAPYLCSRYDTVTGEVLPVSSRIGILDRKLRIVGEKVKTYPTWLKWAYEALRATYGFEYQGDNLLIARINVLETFAEHCEVRWGKVPAPDEVDEAASIVSWNIWQMNGFTHAVPTVDAFADAETAGDGESKEKTPLCVLQDWKTGGRFEFASLKGKDMDSKFYAVIGNPPYQMEGSGNKTFAPPIYHEFMDAAYEVGEKVELVTPARFLFNAGSTPKAWNQKMLADDHFKVELYEPDASKMFPGTDIKGGVAVTYRDSVCDFGAIEHFVSFKELRSILKRVQEVEKKGSFSNLISSRGMYKFTEALAADHPEAMIGKGVENTIATRAFDSMPFIFKKKKPRIGDYITLCGREDNTRVFRYIERKYVVKNDYLTTYNVFVPAANGSGALGEILSTPMIGQPMIGHTDTFLSIGKFNTESEAQACMKYIKTKFARTMLGILKITQHNPAPKWRYVPLQDFTPQSDIDWTKPIPEIDRQLYAKYGLDGHEIEFIETHVKEMD